MHRVTYRPRDGTGLAPAAALVVLLFGPAAWAHVGSNDPAGCFGCHSSATGRMSITAGQTLNLSPRLDGLAPGSQDVFNVVAGQSVTIPILVTNGASQYNMEVFGFNDGGLKNSQANKLAYSVADTVTWVLDAAGAPAPHYTRGLSPLSWGTAQTYNFTVTIGAATPADVYELHTIVAGKESGRWAQGEAVYLNVTPAPEPGVLLGALPLAAMCLLKRRRR